MADIRQTGELDDFQRADADPAGAPWVTVASWTDMQISSNTLKGTSIAGTSIAYYSSTRFEGDGECWGLTSGDAPLGEGWRLGVVEDPSAWTGYVVIMQNQSDGYFWYLRRYDGSGSFEQLGPNPSSAGNPMVGWEYILMRRKGPYIEVWQGSTDASSWRLVLREIDERYSLSYGALGCTGKNEGWSSFGGGGTLNRPQIYRWLAV